MTQREAGADHRRDLQEPDAPPGEALDLPHHRLANAYRKRDPAERRDRRPRALAEEPCELREEEGVAAGSSVQQRHLLLRRRARRHPGQEIGRLPAREPLQRNRTSARAPGDVGERTRAERGDLELALAISSEQQDRHVEDLARQELEQQQGGTVCAVQVVEHQEEGLRERRTSQIPGQAVEEPEARLGHRHAPRRSDGPRDPAQHRLQREEVHGAMTEQRPQLHSVALLGLRPQDLEEGPVGGRPDALVTAREADPHAARSSPASQLFGGARLPDSRLPADEDDAAGALARVLEIRVEVSHLALATDEGTEPCRLRVAVPTRRALELAGAGPRLAARALDARRHEAVPASVHRLDHAAPA